jgi:hypothetical protein
MITKTAIMFLNGNIWVPFVIEIVFFTPEPIYTVAKGGVDKSTSLGPTHFNIHFEPN